MSHRRQKAWPVAHLTQWRLPPVCSSILTMLGCKISAFESPENSSILGELISSCSLPVLEKRRLLTAII